MGVTLQHVRRVLADLAGAATPVAGDLIVELVGLDRRRSVRPRKGSPASSGRAGLAGPCIRGRTHGLPHPSARRSASRSSATTAPRAARAAALWGSLEARPPGRTVACRAILKVIEVVLPTSWRSAAGQPWSPSRQAASPATPALGGVGRTDGAPLPVSLVAGALSPEPPAGGAESGQRPNAHVVHPAREQPPTRVAVDHRADSERRGGHMHPMCTLVRSGNATAGLIRRP